MPPSFTNYPAPRGHIFTSTLLNLPRGHIFTSTLLNASFIYKLPCTPWTYLYIHTTKPAPRGHIFTSTLLNASFIYKLPCTPWTYLYIHTTKCLLHLQTILHPVDISLHPHYYKLCLLHLQTILHPVDISAPTSTLLNATNLREKTIQALHRKSL